MPKISETTLRSCLSLILPDAAGKGLRLPSINPSGHTVLEEQDPKLAYQTWRRLADVPIENWPKQFNPYPLNKLGETTITFSDYESGPVHWWAALAVLEYGALRIEARFSTNQFHLDIAQWLAPEERHGIRYDITLREEYYRERLNLEGEKGTLGDLLYNLAKVPYDGRPVWSHRDTDNPRPYETGENGIYFYFEPGPHLVKGGKAGPTIRTIITDLRHDTCLTAPWLSLLTCSLELLRDVNAQQS